MNHVASPDAITKTGGTVHDNSRRNIIMWITDKYSSNTSTFDNHRRDIDDHSDNGAAEESSLNCQLSLFRLCAIVY